jgi:nucleoside-diphosphate-sugar epimerase
MLNKIIRNDVNRVSEENLSWEKLKNKTILISGATGFVGSFIINSILTHSINYDKNIKIVAIVRNKANAEKMFENYLDTGLITFLQQDVRSEINYHGDIHYIIHAASNAAPKEYASDPAGTMTTNFIGTINLLEFAKKKHIENFLYLSTIEVYGITYGDKTLSEDDFGLINATNVRSCYPISKKASETLCISYSEQYGIPVSIGRLSYLYGPGMKANDSKVIAQFTRDIANGKDLVLKSKGEQLRSYCYISDAVSGLIKVMLDGKNREAYNIASNLCIVTIASIAHKLVELYSEKGLKVVFDLPTIEEKKAFSQIQNAVLSTSKLESLEWMPRINLADGLRYTVESLLE